ncbi:glycerol-3-phosphate acyltransferase 3-like [Colossoma macropomum]|uniref:glycerol-3-phosphate acyltransferase 3-like n=1 Tax=Colossoma macropomum TaxID=42526 RepID=UPI0018652E0B|nr:glycerol-3-phosphate acyltransferase 3-like [Colossoma macropomum]XP_036454002.1 glycerol-3-phosphate acyltransferase 3-like [Colossoma macropomum]XP_036454003.1 glycerol-3-phosphate acyltransferase 3-like [Colossoma macropomum]
MGGFWAAVVPVLQVFFLSLLLLIMLPAMFGFSLGITETYMKILIKTLKWATLKIQKSSREEQTLKHSSSNGLIQRDDSSLEKELGEQRRNRRGDFALSDVFYFSRKGIESIVEDEVTQRFSSEELVSWNLLTRTNNNFHYISLRLTILWGVGVIVRYGILLPLRVTLAAIGLSWLVIGTTAVGFIPNCWLKDWLSELVHVMCYRICARGLSATIHYHNRENKPKKGGICVANHTSPIDVVILANDSGYAMVGQVHGGLMGVVQRAMVRACPHIWFERAEMKDRHLVTQRLRDHVNDKKKLPILIFPEGTCINNTSVMMFKKGSFEIGGTIYPVAIKYDPQFGDAFWNSAKYNMVSYLLRMMTSWAIVCNVWYLPPMTQKEGEDAVQFANRVKSAIAQQGGLVDLSWDGGLKRAKVKDTFKQEQQKKYSSMVVGDDSSE